MSVKIIDDDSHDCGYIYGKRVMWCGRNYYSPPCVYSESQLYTRNTKSDAYTPCKCMKVHDDCFRGTFLLQWHVLVPSGHYLWFYLVFLTC